MRVKLLCNTVLTSHVVCNLLKTMYYNDIFVFTFILFKYMYKYKYI